MKPYGPSVYYASDKIIKDALCQKRIPLTEVRRILRRRGIVVSNDTPREELARYFSRMPYDYYDQERISDALGISKQRDRTTFRVLDGAWTLDAIENAAKQLRTQIAELGDRISVSRSNESLIVQLEYSHVDYRRSEFTQVRHEQGRVDVVKRDDKLCLRGTHNFYVNNFVRELLQAAANGDASLTSESVTLEAVIDPSRRIEFFKLVTEGVEGLHLEEALSVYVYKNMPDSSVLDDQDVEEDQDDDGEHEGETSSDGHIERALLRGRRVQNAGEIKQLYDRGFYTVRYVWSARDSELNVFKIDAGFAEPEACKDFSYAILQVREGIADGPTRRKRSATRDESDRIFSALEKAALNAMTKLVS